ncbi:MAG TPA: MBL fold metallo-hydrolase [Dehalococcoidia bacterium]|nr:MBL fold metallo-hydrolase [Dehalococcoidia bacterium]
MPIQIADHVYQLKVPIPGSPLGATLPYLITGPEGHTLIDTGWCKPDLMEVIRRQLNELGAGYFDLKQIILTHMHPDHSGLADGLREASGAAIVLHDRDRIVRGLSNAANAAELRANSRDWYLARGVPAAEYDQVNDGGGKFTELIGRFKIPKPDIVVYGGEILPAGTSELEVIWTPGHSAGHICLYDRTTRLLYTGDHVLPKITPNVSIHPHETGNPLGDFLASQRRIRDLAVEWYLPAHEYHEQDLAGRVDKLIAHHAARCDEILEIIGADAKTPYEIASKLHWNLNAWNEVAPFMRRLALGETLAHLVYLEDLGQVGCKLRDGVYRYFAERPAPVGAR